MPSDKGDRARPGEVLALKWDDVDFGRRLIIMNHPEKGSNSRTVKVSPKLMKMLARLPTKSESLQYGVSDDVHMLHETEKESCRETK